MGVTGQDPTFSFPIADGARGIVHIFLRDLALHARIGVHRHEAVNSQPVVINLDLTVRERKKVNDKLSSVLDYEFIAEGVRAIVGQGHVRLVETLAERIAGFCLEDARVLAVRVRVEKLEAIAGARSVGVEIERTRKTP